MNQKHTILEMLKVIIILPLAFVVILYIILYKLISPYIPMAVSVFNLVSSQPVQYAPDFEESIFIKNESAENPDKNETDITPGADQSTDPPETQPGETEPDEPEPTPPQPAEISISTVKIPKYEQHYAYLYISKLKIECRLYYGDSDAVLKKGAGQYMGSGLPGFGKPILIAAHNNLHFRALEWAEIGMIVKIETSYGIYEYKINEIAIYKYDDDSAYDLSQRVESLILYTCHPFGSLGFKSDRIFVYAEKVSGPEVK